MLHQRRAATFGILGVIALALRRPGSGIEQVAGEPVERTIPTSAPRTSWGDPDLEGKWPGTNMAGVPLQRPESFGTRNVLTDEEIAARQAQAARQVDQDNADFDFKKPERAVRPDRRRAVAAAAFVRARGDTAPVSLIVDPPNGRLPALTAAAQKREANRRANAASAAGVLHGLFAV